MSVDIKGLVARSLQKALSKADQALTDEKELRDFIEIPPQKEFGDYAVPCFRFAKITGKSPTQTALDLERVMTAPAGLSGHGAGAAGESGGSGRCGDGDDVPGRGIIRSVEARGPYLNLFLDKSSVVSRVIEDLATHGFGSLSRHGAGRTAVVDFSSPNIAKPFGIGHLRSTVIGNSLCRIYSAIGYRVVGINHLGDWGTQFGKLITAFKRWGNDNELGADPIKYLFQLYVRFHAEAETKPELEDEARAWFSRLEGGDSEATRLWKRFRDLSIEEFQKIYRRLGVTFDHFTGESFYGGMLDRTVREIVARGVTAESEGALVVPLEEDMPPVLIKKRDDATLYMTRDIAAALYRHETYRFDIALYVVGSPQTLHFRQLFGVLGKMGLDWVDRCHHVPFGQIGFADGAMSTRRGNVIFLEDVLDRAVDLARGIVEGKNPDLRGKDEVAEAVGVGAIIFNDLKNSRIKDITFDWNEILNFDGETGPYLQYTHARITSLLKNFRGTHGDLAVYGSGGARGGRDVAGPPAQGGPLFGEEGYDLALLVNDFEETVLRAAREFEPSVISRRLLELASAFNAFYNKHRVVTEDRDLSLARALVVAAVRDVLGKGLELLGIRALEEM